MGEPSQNNDILLEVNVRRAKILRYAGLFLPLLLVAYSVYLQLVPGVRHYPLTPLIIAINASWVILALYHFFTPMKTRHGAIARIILFHIIALLYILFVSGFDMPFIYVWSVLFLASAVHAGAGGVKLSLAMLFVAASASVIISADDLTRVFQIGLHFAGTLIVACIMNAIVTAQAIDQRELLRSQTEEKLQRDRVLTIVNNLADAILSVDSRGTIQLYNAAALDLLDTNSELTGKKIDAVLTMKNNEGETVKFTQLLHRIHSVRMRDDLSAKISGEVVHLSVVYSPIRNANSTHASGRDGYIIILRDITKQKSLEDERDEFISVVSHELRTPIAIAEGSLSNVQLMMERPDIPQTTLHDGVNAAHQQVVFLAKMANDLSTLSRAERGVADTPELIDVAELISELYAEYSPEATEKSLYFDLDLDPQLGAVNESRLYLKELLQNIVTNAIKYTQTGGVTVSVKRSAPRLLTFTVKDTGIGISRSDQQHLFQKFWRSEDYRTRETGGTGLGLYVAHKLAKKLNTTIELKSRLNHGSTFSFSLPSTKRRK